MYDPKAKEAKAAKIETLQQIGAMGLTRRLCGPIAVKLVFHTGGAKKRGTKAPGAFKPIKPDLDNMVKFYLDVMNDLVYEDDRFIVKIECEKRYSDEVKTEAWVREL